MVGAREGLRGAGAKLWISGAGPSEDYQLCCAKKRVWDAGKSVL